jgi:hypothetical protein
MTQGNGVLILHVPPHSPEEVWSLQIGQQLLKEVESAQMLFIMAKCITSLSSLAYLYESTGWWVE